MLRHISSLPPPSPVQNVTPAGGVGPKVRKPIWKRWWFWVVMVFVALLVIGGLAGGGETDDGATGAGATAAPATTQVTEPTASTAAPEASSPTETTAAAVTTAAPEPEAIIPFTTPAAELGRSGDDPNPGALYAGRVDTQREDQERAIGEPVRLSGYTAVAVSAAFEEQLNDFATEGYVVVDVTVVNRDDTTQPVNPFDWRLQTPAGQVLDITFLGDNFAGSDLVTGGSISGQVVFEIGGTRGDFFLIYKPDPFDAARGIWKVTV